MNLCYNKIGEKMKIRGKTKVLEVILCNHFWDRFKGNMGKKNIQNVLVFPKCNAIHTFFMKEAIDVVMISCENQVLYIRNNMPPYHILLPKRKVKTTLEFPKGENPYSLGDFLSYQ